MFEQGFELFISRVLVACADLKLRRQLLAVDRGNPSLVGQGVRRSQNGTVYHGRISLAGADNDALVFGVSCKVAEANFDTRFEISARRGLTRNGAYLRHPGFAGAGIAGLVLAGLW